MSNRFIPLQNGQRIEVYLEDGKIREGTFYKWMPVEGTNYLIVDQDDRIKDGKKYQVHGL
jgi:hypothetical protein